jgi:hypothetical protein
MVAVTHDELPKSPTIDYLIFALRGVAAYRQFEIALAPDGEPVAPATPEASGAPDAPDGPDVSQYLAGSGAGGPA